MTLYEKFVTFIDEFTERPLNIFFKEPVQFDEETDEADYNQMIKNKIYLRKILEDIDEDKYQKDIHLIIKDVCLVYENAITFHKSKDNRDWVEVSQFLLNTFIEESSAFNNKGASEWTEKYKQQLEKLGDIITNTPVKQGLDDFVHYCLKVNELNMSTDQINLQKMVGKMKKMIMDEEHKVNFYNIIKKFDKEIFSSKEAETSTPAKLEIDKLSNQCINALHVYISSFPDYNENENN